MSETPKKPRAKKKAEPKADAAPETPQETSRAERQESQSDDALKAAVLAAALPHAAFDGFSQKVLDEAGKQAGVAKAELKRLFPEGALGLVEFYSAQADAEMEKRLAALDLSKLKIRARIAAAVTARLQVLKPHKEAARRAAAMLALPMHAALAAKLLYRTVDTMWRAAGDTATDFNFYTKRGILAGVYGSTLMRWFNDTSADESATTEFLAARIENVMQFETLKAQVKTGFGRFAAAFAQTRKPE
jgi:ubiquinone biosynthesis protein COQ9